MGRALWSEAPPHVSPKKGVVGTVEVLVRVRVLVVDAQERPVPGARVVLAATPEVMRTEEDVERIREAIEFRVGRGQRSKWAIGTTDQGGIADLEYTWLTDSDDPLFEEEQGAFVREFRFGNSARIDAKTCGTVFGHLQGAKNARYRRLRLSESSTGPWLIAEAEFVLRCERPPFWTAVRSVEELRSHLDKAEKESKPVVAFVWAAWCDHCRTLDKMMQEDAEIRASLEGVERVLIDVTSGPRDDLRDLLGAPHLIQPILVFITDHGQILRELSGAAKRTDVLRRLRDLGPSPR